jgi:hypothetical protein
MFTHSFHEDLNIIKNKILNKEPFAFARYADFELAVILNRGITSCDNITVAAEDKPFGKELYDTLFHKEHNYLYGISCPCCDMQSFKLYESVLKESWDRVSFSNMFVNSNWNSAVEFLMNYQNKIFICNENCKLDIPFYKVPSNVLIAYRTQRETLKNYYEEIAEKYNNTLFCISAGPLAEIIIHWMYNKNSNNQYIDVGSALDPFLHKAPTRSYHETGHTYNLRTCVF